MACYGVDDDDDDDDVTLWNVIKSLELQSIRLYSIRILM